MKGGNEDGQERPPVLLQTYARNLLLMKETFEDKAYCDCLLICLQDFGKAIHTSLTRIFTKFLDREGCDGSYAERINDPDRQDAVAPLLATNDLSEGIFSNVSPFLLLVLSRTMSWPAFTFILIARSVL